MLDRRVSVALAVALLASASVLGAEEKRQATGKFEGKNWTFEVFGAYAYPGEVGLDDVPGIRVAVSNYSFGTDYLDRYWDREHAIDTYHKDDKALVFTLHFEKSGKYAGSSYYFESGDGCGFCFDGSAVSTVKVKNGRIGGKITLAPKPNENSYEIEFDIPIAPSDYGKPLPAGGGEPGKVYTAYHEAISAWDKAKTKPFFSDNVQAKFAEQGDDILQAFRKDHPDVKMKIVRGFQRDDVALLLVEGAVSYSNVETEVHLRKEGGTWRIVDEVLQVAAGAP